MINPLSVADASDLLSDARPLWERDMTICIAAICENSAQDEAKILLCTDGRESHVLGVSDRKLKLRSLARAWSCLTAGYSDDAAAVIPMLRAEFIEAGDEISETNIREIIARVFLKRKRQKAEEITQGKFGLEYEKFLQVGKEQLPAERFYSAMGMIERLNLGVSLIFAGFVNGFPLLVRTTEDGEIKIKEGYACIGEGAHLATAWLLYREHDDTMPQTHAMYSVWEAKRHSERVASVGYPTMLAIMRSKQEEPEYVAASASAYLDKMLGELSPKPLSSVAFERDALGLK